MVERGTIPRPVRRHGPQATQTTVDKNQAHDQKTTRLDMTGVAQFHSSEMDGVPIWQAYRQVVRI